MKKIVICLILGFSALTINAQAFSSEAFQANKKVIMGIGGGYMHFPNDVSRGAMTINLTVFGFYGDFSFWPGMHSNDVNVGEWYEKTSYAFHLGYQIPIIKQVRIIPVIGYAWATNTYTDGYNYKVDYNSNSGIRNYQSTNTEKSGIDYGGILSINPCKKLNISIGGTAHMYYGTIGIEF